MGSFEDVSCAQSRARRFAADSGFSVRGQWELALAVSEAATNIVKYGVRGTILLRRDWDVVEMVATDSGPGFTDVVACLRDGISEGRDRSSAISLAGFRGLGLGLGAVARLTDELVISNLESGGALVRARKRRC